MESRLLVRAHSRKPRASDSPSRPSLSAGRLLVIFAPILVLIASTPALAAVAWLIGWHRTEMLIVAEVTGTS